jgi:hypothetical protein
MEAKRVNRFSSVDQKDIVVEEMKVEPHFLEGADSLLRV